jgi:hypothetical protein
MMSQVLEQVGAFDQAQAGSPEIVRWIVGLSSSWFDGARNRIWRAMKATRWVFARHAPDPRRRPSTPHFQGERTVAKGNREVGPTPDR